MVEEHLLAVGTPGLSTLSGHLQLGEFMCGVVKPPEPGGVAADSCHLAG